VRRAAPRRAPPHLRERDAGPEPAPRCLARPQLEHRPRAAAGRHAPRAQVGGHLHHAIGAVEEDGILVRRELDLAAKEAELNRLQASIAHAERDASRGRDLDEWTARLEEREKQLAAREAHKKRADRKEARLSDLEETLHDRHKELDDRESELDLHQAQLTADVEIRTDKLEEREQALAELEERLANQERELGEYVAKAQTEIQRRESEWWKQQLGEGASAA
jgi:chromosome segregation ATPase